MLQASCRRNFALDVALLDALGRSIHKDMEVSPRSFYNKCYVFTVMSYLSESTASDNFLIWLQLVALLVYADSGAPVEKPKDDSEAPLLTTFDGVEFPSTERPIKLVHGRASFKLKISQVCYVAFTNRLYLALLIEEVLI